VTWRAREASFGSFCSIFYPLSNGVSVKSIRVQIKKLQSFKNGKNTIFEKNVILAIFILVQEGSNAQKMAYLYQKALNYVKQVQKRHFKIFHFSRKLKEWGISEIIFYYFLKFNISVTWRAREASFGSFCSIFYPFFNGVSKKYIRV